MTDEEEVLTEKRGWHRMDLREFHEAGLLAQANAAFFWPLGLALTVAIDGELLDKDAQYVGLFVQRLDPFEPIVSGDTAEEQDERADKLAAWMKERFA